ncbi:DNA methyltransferase, partial [Streptomyces sp. NPDC088341]
MALHHQTDDGIAVHHGDMLDELRALPDQSVDVVITDPPYGLADHHPRVVASALAAWLAGDRDHVPDGRGFMGREWDRFVPPPAAWDECWRVLKPGGWLLAFAAPRTADLMGMSIRLAGFEIRDGMQWLFAQGFPKGQDVGKAIDRMRSEDAPAVRAVTGWLDAQRLAAGVSRQTIDAVFGTDGMARHWTTQGRTACVPTVEQWEKLRTLLGFGPDMDAEVARLNARKGQRGEAFAAREVVGHRPSGLAEGQTSVFLQGMPVRDDGMVPVTVAASDEARRWQGWNTSLKPAHEPIVMARKSTGHNSITANVLEHGVGALNIDACRVDASGRPLRITTGGVDTPGAAVYGAGFSPPSRASGTTDVGRWPTNVVLSHAPLLDDAGEVVGDGCADGCADGCPVADLDAQNGTLTSGANPTRRGSDKFRDAYGEFAGQTECTPARGADSGGASRFFPTFRYQAKAPASERPRTADGVAHPTVKPLALMRWLVRLVCPPGGVVLDPFGGS